MTETNRIEFKRELTRDLDIEREVVAFLNYHEGGMVYIGIDDKGKVAGTLPFGMSKADFFNGVSNPRNKELMRVFRDVDMVEALGTGMLRVLKVYKEENFVFMDNFIRVVIPYNWIPSELANGNPENKAVNVLDNILENTVDDFEQLTVRQQNIINRMIETGKMNVLGNVIVNVLETSASLAEYFGVNERTIRRDLRFLQEHNFLRHVGPDKGGHWEVIRTNEQ